MQKKIKDLSVCFETPQNHGFNFDREVATTV